MIGHLLLLLLPIVATKFKDLVYNVKKKKKKAAFGRFATYLYIFGYLKIAQPTSPASSVSSNNSSNTFGVGLGQNSSAMRGNFLEAVNMALQAFDLGSSEKEFTRTGCEIIVLSPGNGVFEINSALRKITKETLLRYGVCCDLICLAKPPLHKVPMLVWKEKEAKDQV